MEEIPQGLERFIARQMRKRHLAGVWARLAGLQPGMVVVDFGCGPGILTKEYVRIVGQTGFVCCVEQNKAVAAKVEPGDNVLVMFQNYDSALNLEHMPDIVFLTDTLHHLANGIAALRRIRAACGPRTRLFIAEYDPDKPGLVGAKLHRRLAKADVLSMLEAAGFRHQRTVDTEDEHYAVIAGC